MPPNLIECNAIDRCQQIHPKRLISQLNEPVLLSELLRLNGQASKPKITNSLTIFLRRLYEKIQILGIARNRVNGDGKCADDTIADAVPIE